MKNLAILESPRLPISGWFAGGAHFSMSLTWKDHQPVTPLLSHFFAIVTFGFTTIAGFGAGGGGGGT